MNRLLLLFGFVILSSDFYYMQEAINFMNKMPTASKESSYIVALNDERAKSVNNFYSVIYRRYYE